MVFETSFKEHGGHDGRHIFVAPVKSNKNSEKWPKFSMKYIGFMLFGYRNIWDMLKVLENEWILCINGIFLLEYESDHDHNGGHVGLVGFLLNLIKCPKSDQNSSCRVWNSVVWSIYVSIIWNLCQNHLEFYGYST